MAVLARPRLVDPWSASCFDIRYEFCAPHFFDFCVDESDAQVRATESWFQIAAGYDPSPYNLQDDGCFEQAHKQIVVSTSDESSEEVHLKLLLRLDNHVPDANPSIDMSDVDLTTPGKDEFSPPLPELVDAQQDQEILFPAKRVRPQEQTPQGVAAKRPAKRNVTKKKKPTVKQQQAPQTPVGNACKRRKLEGGVQKQMQKSTPSVTVPRAFQLSTDKRAQTHRRGDYGTVSKMGDLCSSFTSLAEQVQLFYLKTPERFRKTNVLNKSQKPVMLSKAKEPELETSHRSRPPRVKSAAELEEEMLSKLPKFKARPANKKILEAPSLPALPRSTPQLPQFQEFNLKTTDRAMQHNQKCSEPSNAFSERRKKQRRKSDPGGGQIHISARVRSRPKSTEELEREELARIPKFKALPLNRKIFESRGDLGIFRHQKRQVTVPAEFNFATNERFQHQEDDLVKSFRRLSLDSRPRPATGGRRLAQPFHLLTEERGTAKMAKFVQELSKQLLTESMARIPKATLLPFTTDYPTVPPKPEQKACTKPEPFQLESMLRHEQEQQRLQEERERAEKHKAELSKFRAQPINCCGPVFIPERSRKPLTEIKEFNFQVDSRAVQRAAYEKKILEKQNLYKQLKEELEAARKEEEERFIKALRKELIPQARPMPLFDRPFVPQRSSKPLTLPHTPQLNLARKQRAEAPFVYRKFRMKASGSVSKNNIV